MKIVSTEEIKAYTGLTVADSKVELFNTVGSRLLASQLGINQFFVHEVENEQVIVPRNGQYIRLKSFPVQKASIKIYYRLDEELTEYSFREDPYDFRKFWVLRDSKESVLLYDWVYATYNAGFILQDTLTVESNVLTGEKLTVKYLGEETIYTFVASDPADDEIEIGASIGATAQNIADKLDCEVDGADVTLLLGMSASFNDATLIDIESADDIEDLKIAVAFIVAGAISDDVRGDVAEYRLGSKNVKFRDNSEYEFVKKTIDRYAKKYKRVNIC